MDKGVAVFFVLLLLAPSAYSISIKELASRYLFSFSSEEIGVLNYTDYMADKDSNGLNDTLIIELTANANGRFIFVVNVLDKNGILTNETNATFSGGTRKLNASFNSFLLSQDRFNYSIKIYNSTNGLKYRRDNIPTSPYANYEEGFSLFGISDSKIGNKLRVNVTINSSLNGTFQPLLFLRYNSSDIYSKQSFQIIKNENHLVFEFDNETIKKTHYNGKYNVSSLKIGGKTIRTNYTTSEYSFRDFAASSYIHGFTDGKLDPDSDNNYDLLQINASIYAFREGIYNLKLSLYDLFGNMVEIKNISALLDSGNQTISAGINGTRIYNKKLNGPFAVKYAELYENYTLADKINDAYTTSNYNFNDFYASSLPDIIASISVSDGYHYGANNLTVNITLKNAGNKHAFNVFLDIFDNNTLFKTNKSNIMLKNSEIFYQLDFTNASDFEISAIADFQGLVDESNESNNAEKILVRINDPPVLEPVNNLAINATLQIGINLSAFDPDDDNILFSINHSKFFGSGNAFTWNTTLNDSGGYVFAATASDGFLNDSKIFEVEIINISKKSSNDLDLDGIDDSIDNFIGNADFVKTSTLNLSILVNSSNVIEKVFNDSLLIQFLDGKSIFAEFYFNFTRDKLNLTNVTLEKQKNNSRGLVLVSNLILPREIKKFVYVDRTNLSFNQVCIKDAQVSSINEASAKCTGKSGVVRVKCNGKLARKTYRCIYNSTTNKYKVTGLSHTLVMQTK